MAYPIIDSLIGSNIMLDGQLTDPQSPAAQFCFDPTEERMFYEVIRIESGIPLFWEDHLLRLTDSIQDQFEIPDSLYADSLRLIDANGLGRANLRLVLSNGRTILHQTPSYYPSITQMTDGVSAGLLAWEREDPNVKIIISAYKAAIAARFAAKGPFGDLFELLLADHSGELTEGSRTNLFFIRGNDVFSAPDHRILKGITRKYVTTAIATAGGQLREQLFTLDQIAAGEVDAAFISGSPIDLLPLSAIESVRLTSATHPLFIRINAAYQQIVQNYLRDHSRQSSHVS